MPAIITSYSTEHWQSLSHSNQTRKTKGIQIGREDVRLSRYSDDLTLYTENLRFTQKLPELVNKFSNAAGYKTDAWKSVTFLYINNETSENVNKSFLPNASDKIQE